MDTATILTQATNQINQMIGHRFDVLDISKPISTAAALNLLKIISKLSPLIGNLIEFNIVEMLNKHNQFSNLGSWIRQDPGFPDAIFQSGITPSPGFEIKAWFPLSTEITARFKDSATHFQAQNIYMILIAWVPEYLVYGKPKILDIAIIEGGSIARSRDLHYHNPPDYLLLEPNDTTHRSRNLQQTTVNGYKWQGTSEEFQAAAEIVETWGQEGLEYNSSPIIQQQYRQLINRYPYRLDTNFAKIDRIRHPEIETFKRQIYQTQLHGLTIQAWSRLFTTNMADQIRTVFQQQLNLKEDAATSVLE
ncbi:hypothetical protein [Herpetosiphon giganteus]|uniref:hypothetical protein n=1 Tax=Herpetosiphon giganteus TaxID=2029754 RepID=UPI00195AC965|nr:hypothetical protein [Herpetosiphon giganteus]MBM7842661.1 hypothetical protein [Herpetosiphon giganteus]